MNGKRDAITRNDLLSSAGNMGIKKAEAERIISEVQDSQARWNQYAETAWLREADAEKIRNAFIRL